MPTRFRDASPSVPALRPHRWWWIAAVGTTLLVLAVHIRIAWGSAIAPRTPWDEVNYLEIARLLSGDADTAPMLGSGYHPGWSMLLVPVWWFTKDPQTVYIAGIAIGIAVAVATIWPLTLLAKQVGLATPQAWTAAGATMLLPGRTVVSDYVLAEQWLTFVLVWAVVAAFAVWRTPTMWRMAGFVAVVLAAYFAHSRALALMGAAGIWLVAWLWHRWRLALAGLAMLAVGYFVVTWGVALINNRLLLAGFGKGELMSTAISTTTPVLVAKVGAAQVWAQIVGSWGLFAVGLVVLATWAWRELQGRRLGPAGFVAGMVTATVLTSVLWWAGPKFLFADNPRFDVWIYTRYIDPAATIVVLLAIAAILMGLSRAMAAVAWAVAALVSVFVLLWVAPDAPTWGSYRGPGNTAALLHWRDLWPTGEPYERPLYSTFTNPNRFWLIATVATLLAMGFAVLMLRLRAVMIAGIVVLLTLTSLVANPSQYRDPPRAITAGIEHIEEDGVQRTVDFDRRCKRPGVNNIIALNWLGFWLSPRTLTVVDRDVEDFSSELVVSCVDWEEAGDYGARPMKDAQNYTYRLWVLPGETQDRLAEEDLLGEMPPPSAD